MTKKSPEAGARDTGPDNARLTRLLVVVLFTASGVSALIYQVVWMRMLATVLGSTSYATAAVLAAFMGGLAVGAWVLGRVVDRHPRPLAVFAMLEVGIGITALALPFMFGVAAPLYGAAYGLSGDYGVGRAILQFVFSIACLIVPTFLMGGTLPALVRAAVHPSRAGAGLAFLYGANTLGAALGALLAGFALIPVLGLFKTLLLATLINVVNGTVAWLMRMPVAPLDAPVPSDRSATSLTARRWPAHAVLAAAVVSGFVGLASEVAWTRILSFGLGSTTYAFAAMLVTYLLGLALGSLVATRALPGVVRPLRALAIVQGLVGVAMVASLVIYIRFADAIGAYLFSAAERSWSRGMALDFAVAALALLPSTLMMGAAFPLAYAAYAEGRPRLGSAIGRLYAVNTIGGVSGSLAAGFVLIPILGLQRTLLLLAGASLITCAALLLVEAPRGRTVLSSLVPLGAAAGLVALPIVRPFHTVGPTERLLFYREGPTSTVSVVEDALGTRKLFIDKIAVAGTDPVLLTDQKSLAHVPMLLTPKATRALTVGFGSGGASWSFTRYNRLEQVDSVEIDRTVLEAAPYLAASHHGVLSHPRFQMITEDARTHLLNTDKSYDIISTDCTDLRYKSNAMLYTREYFQLCRRRLNPGGIVAVWLPLGGLSTEALRIALATFASVFPHTSIWYMNNVPAHYALLIGSAGPLTFDVATIKEQLREATVYSDLAEIGLADAWKLYASHVTDGDGVAKLAAGARLNTDDRPILEFMVPRGGFKGTIAANLLELLGVRRPASLAGVADADREVATRYWDSGGELVRGHATFLKGNHDYRGAMARYQLAAALNPSDAEIPRLVGRVRATEAAKLSELQAITGDAPNDPEAINDLGLVWLSLGDAAKAAAQFEHAARLEPRDWEPAFNLGVAHERIGDAAKAEAAYRDAASRRPTVAAPLTNLGLLLLARGDLSNATLELQRAATLAQGNADAAYNLALAYHRAGRLADAAASYQEAIRLRPSHAAALTNLGTIALAQRRPVEAARQFDLAIDAEPGYAEAHYNRGLMLDEQGRYSDAAKAYRQALRLRPAYAEAHNNLGILEARAGNAETAMAHYRQAIQANPEYVDAYTNLALALVGAGRAPEARVEAEHAVRLGPNLSQAHVSLGLACWRSGDPAVAISAFQRALALDPSLPNVRSWLEALRAKR